MAHVVPIESELQHQIFPNKALRSKIFPWRGRRAWGPGRADKTRNRLADGVRRPLEAWMGSEGLWRPGWGPNASGGPDGVRRLLSERWGPG